MTEESETIGVARAAGVPRDPVDATLTLPTTEIRVPTTATARPSTALRSGSAFPATLTLRPWRLAATRAVATAASSARATNSARTRPSPSGRPAPRTRPWTATRNAKSANAAAGTRTTTGSTEISTTPLRPEATVILPAPADTIARAVTEMMRGRATDTRALPGRIVMRKTGRGGQSDRDRRSRTPNRGRLTRRRIRSRTMRVLPVAIAIDPAAPAATDANQTSVTGATVVALPPSPTRTTNPTSTRTPPPHAALLSRTRARTSKSAPPCPQRRRMASRSTRARTAALCSPAKGLRWRRTSRTANVFRGAERSG